MRFKLYRTSDLYSDVKSMVVVEPKTVDDIITIAKSYGHEVIIHPPETSVGRDDFPFIEVYDDYRE